MENKKKKQAPVIGDLFDLRFERTYIERTYKGKPVVPLHAARGDEEVAIRLYSSSQPTTETGVPIPQGLRERYEKEVDAIADVGKFLVPLGNDVRRVIEATWKSIPVTERLAAGASVDDIVDPTDLHALLKELSGYSNDAWRHEVEVKFLRNLILSYLHLRRTQADTTCNYDLKKLAESYMKTPLDGKPQVRSLTDPTLPVPGGKALESCAKEDAAIRHVYLDTEATLDPKFIEECLGKVSKEGLLPLHFDHVNTSVSSGPVTVYTPPVWRDALYRLFSTETGRFSAAHPNLSQGDDPKEVTKRIQDLRVPVYLSGNTVTTVASVFGRSCRIGRLLGSGEQVVQGRVNKYVLQETGEWVRVLLDMGPDSYVINEGDTPPPDWFNPAMQWFLFNTAEKGQVILKDPNAFVVSVLGAQIQGSEWEFRGVDENGAKELRLLLTGAEHIRKARAHCADVVLKIRTAINYGKGWACKVTGKITSFQQGLAVHRYEEEQALVSFALQEDFHAGPVYHGFERGALWTLSSKRPHSTEKDPKAVLLDFDRLLELPTREQRIYSCPTWLFCFRKQYRRLISGDGNYTELSVCPEYAHEFHVVVNDQSSLGFEGVTVSFNQEPPGPYQTSVLPIVEMPAYYVIDHAFARTMGEQVQGGSLTPCPITLQLVHRVLKWQVVFQGCWVTEMRHSPDGSTVRFSLVCKICEAGPVPSNLLEGQLTATTVDASCDLDVSPASDEGPTWSELSLGKSEDEVALMLLEKQQLKAATDQLLGVTAALTYIVPKEPKNDR